MGLGGRGRGALFLLQPSLEASTGSVISSCKFLCALCNTCLEMDINTDNKKHSMVIAVVRLMYMYMYAS